jgi:signal transduction histidine kinase
MNLLGNSLKFTSVCLPLRASRQILNRILQDGFVHIGLRQLPNTADMPENNVKIELSVLDSGKVKQIIP